MLTNRKKYTFSLIIILFFLTLISSVSQSQDINQINLANEYYSMGDVEKAIDIYKKLARDSKNIPIIHKNYFDLLLSLEDLKTAERYIDDVIRLRPDNIYYTIDKGLLYTRTGEVDKESNYYRKIFMI